jgi:antitoxin component of MazEF toxin-antitoxin module
MNARIQKWGNSLAVRIPAVVARQIQVGEGDSVEMRVNRKGLLVSRARPSYRLSDLLKRIDDDNRHGETHWGKPRGKEVW